MSDREPIHYRMLMESEPMQAGDVAGMTAGSIMLVKPEWFGQEARFHSMGVFRPMFRKQINGETFFTDLYGAKQNKEGGG